MDYNLDTYTNEEIRELINSGKITEQDAIDYFNNEWLYRAKIIELLSWIDNYGGDL